MNKLKVLWLFFLVCLVAPCCPYGAIVFLAGCLLVAHVYAVSLGDGPDHPGADPDCCHSLLWLKPGDSYLIVLTPLAFLFKIPYAVPLLVGLGGSLASVIPVGCGVFLYYLIMYVKQNAGVLTNDASVDIVQKYSQILKSVTFNQTMMVMIATCAVGILVVYLIRRLSMDYAWIVAIVAGCVAQLLVIFVGISCSACPCPWDSCFWAGVVSFGASGAGLRFLYFSVDYTRTGTCAV